MSKKGIASDVSLIYHYLRLKYEKRMSWLSVSVSVVLVNGCVSVSECMC